MYRGSILFILIILSLTGGAQKTGTTRSSLFSCQISTEKRKYNVGETPEITVEINNNSKNPAYLVRVLDGSAGKWRFPHAYFTIVKAGDSSFKTIEYGMCRNLNEIRVEDFVKVNPGELFNPYLQTETGAPKFAWHPQLMDKNNFVKPGKYILTFYYSTMAKELDKWRGKFSGGISQGDLKKITNLFSKLTHINVVSNSLVIEII